MSNLKQFLPAATIAQIKGKVKYEKGYPFQCKTDMRTGILALLDDTPITKKDEPIVMRVVAINVFKAKLFGYSERFWCELFFINGLNAVAVAKFHGYSAENLMTAIRTASYTGIDIANSLLAIRFKTAKSGTFRVAQFHFEACDDAENESWAKVVIENGDNVFDETTIGLGSILRFNYRNETTF